MKKKKKKKIISVLLEQEHQLRKQGYYRKAKTYSAKTDNRQKEKDKLKEDMDKLINEQ
jgi:hypothetical protein